MIWSKTFHLFPLKIKKEIRVHIDMNSVDLQTIKHRETLILQIKFHAIPKRKEKNLYYKTRYQMCCSIERMLKIL